jgi:threonine dehydrogenase-like Zn-dependent dehydrogenase
MRAVTWQGKRDVRVEEVPDPRIELPTDALWNVEHGRGRRIGRSQREEFRRQRRTTS